MEYESGNKRTTLEVIQSRTILLDSKISLATSEKNFLISQFNLLSSIGRLTAKQLNLKKWLYGRYGEVDISRITANFLKNVEFKGFYWLLLKRTKCVHLYQWFAN